MTAPVRRAITPFVSCRTTHRSILNRGTPPSTAAAQVPGPAGVGPVAIRYFDRPVDGVSVAETANFRILSNQPRELIEKVAQVAEQTRAAMQRKWFGTESEDWNPRCDLHLYASGQEYHVATRMPLDSPGHSTISTDRGRVVARRNIIDGRNALVPDLWREAGWEYLAPGVAVEPAPRAGRNSAGAWTR